MKKIALFLTVCLSVLTTTPSGKKQQYRLRQKQRARTFALKQFEKKQKVRKLKSDNCARRQSLANKERERIDDYYFGTATIFGPATVIAALWLSYAV